MADYDSDRLQDPPHISANMPTHGGYASSDAGSSYALDRLSQAFETSARRWELIVYPSLFAFIILAAYGFYLIFSLAKDMHYLTISVDSNMTTLASNMQAVADNMGQLTRNVRSMTVQVEAMAHSVKTMEPMLTSIKKMDQSMQSMTFAIHNIRTDTSVLSKDVGQMGRPMSFFNSFTPW